MQYLISPYIGDVARYVRADPRNIAVRRSIRERGIKLLEEIHKSGNYERVIVVAHSLGTIVAYDVVSLFWTKRTKAALVPESDDGFKKLREVERAAHALKNANESNRKDLFFAYREAQREFRLTLRDGGKDGKGRKRAVDEEWLISDLITLGSPLAHAEFLLSRDKTDLEEKFRRFLFPTNWPQFQLIQSEQMEKLDARSTPSFDLGPKEGLFSYVRDSEPEWWVLHGAPFASVRWTNIYDNHRLVFQGDVISGAVAPGFGGGILDIDLKDLRGQSTHFSHTLYWSRTNNDPQGFHLEAMRNAINLLDKPDGELWKTMLPDLKIPKAARVP